MGEYVHPAPQDTSSTTGYIQHHRIHPAPHCKTDSSNRQIGSFYGAVMGEYIQHHTVHPAPHCTTDSSNSIGGSFYGAVMGEYIQHHTATAIHTSLKLALKWMSRRTAAKQRPSSITL